MKFKRYNIPIIDLREIDSGITPHEKSHEELHNKLVDVVFDGGPQGPAGVNGIEGLTGYPHPSNHNSLELEWRYD